MKLGSKLVIEGESFRNAPSNSIDFTFHAAGKELEIKCRFLSIPHTVFPVLSRFNHPGPPFTRIFLFKTGGAKVSAAGKSFRLIPGMIYLLPSNQPFEVAYSKSDLYAFHLHICDKNGLSIFDGPRGVLRAKNKPVFENILTGVDSKDELIAQTAVFQAVALFLESIKEELIEKELKNEKYEKLLRIIQNGKHGKLKIDALSKKMRISRHALSKGFSRSFGISLKDYIANVTLSKAKHELASSDRTILEISDYLGFNEASYFHRFFKNKTGMPPLDYRRKIKAEYP